MLVEISHLLAYNIVMKTQLGMIILLDDTKFSFCGGKIGMIMSIRSRLQINILSKLQYIEMKVLEFNRFCMKSNSLVSDAKRDIKSFLWWK